MATMTMREKMGGWASSSIAIAYGLVVGAWMTVSFMLGSQVWAWWAGASMPLNPFAAIVVLARGQITPTSGLWGCVITIGVVMAAAPMVWRVARRGRRQRRRRGDGAARLTGRSVDTAPLNQRDVTAKARRLGVDVDKGIGLPIGRAVAGARWLWSSFEDVCVVIAGPRTGKTTRWVVPRILKAPGAVVATSNKRDILDATKAARGRRGTVWVFDPQGLADTGQQWWWDIMAYVTDAMQAEALAKIFSDTTREPGAQVSAYFDAAARNLISGLLLAAARAGRPITELHRWLNDETDREPARILRDAGEDLMAQTVDGILNLVPETRSGVFGSASTIMNFLLNEQAMRWVTPQPFLTQFDPGDLVRSNDTLYCLSQEGRRSAAPIVTALTVAVTEAAVNDARKSSTGRLTTPLLIMLDEAANVCRWSELPSMYSHFGSRGICVDTLLQSWSQGASVWGEDGVKKLWSAANVKVYGGGVSEKVFLADLSELLGSYWIDSKQINRSRQGWSKTVTKESQQRRIATVSDLQSLPAGRAWVLASGIKPVLTSLIPYWEL